MRTYAFYKGRREENPDSKLFDIGVTHWPRSKGRFSHVERVYKGEGYSSSFRDGGVRVKEIATWNSGHWEFVTIPGPDEAALDIFHRQAGKPYDVLGLFGFVLPFWVENPGAWFCSEICACAEGLDKPYQWHPNRLYAHLLSRDGAVVHSTL